MRIPIPFGRSLPGVFDVQDDANGSVQNGVSLNRLSFLATHTHGPHEPRRNSQRAVLC